MVWRSGVPQKRQLPDFGAWGAAAGHVAGESATDEIGICDPAPEAMGWIANFDRCETSNICAHAPHRGRACLKAAVSRLQRHTCCPHPTLQILGDVLARQLLKFRDRPEAEGTFPSAMYPKKRRYHPG